MHNDVVLIMAGALGLFPHTLMKNLHKLPCNRHPAKFNPMALMGTAHRLKCNTFSNAYRGISLANRVDLGSGILGMKQPANKARYVKWPDDHNIIIIIIC